MQKHIIDITTASCQQHAALLTNPDYSSTQSAARRLLLLHGAGVAGEITWTFVANYLHEWDEILIPDFAGMGESAFLHNKAPSLHDYVRQIDELLEHLGWRQFDIAGYSFGGMVAERYLRSRDFAGLCFLLEPAMLFSSDEADIRSKATTYLGVAAAIMADPQGTEPYRLFLDAVSPKRVRNDRAEMLTLKRLQAHAEGFACALKAVSQALLDECAYFMTWHAMWPGVSFVGELSLASMHERHQRLARESANWRYVTVEHAEHSLVFTRPRTIAEVMNNLRREHNA